MTLFGNGVVSSAAGIALTMLAAAFLLTLYRLIRGPSLPDRVVALDLMAAIGVGIMATYSLISGESSILDAALVVAMITFLGTVAFASYLERGGSR
jgi:multicomponent Na+:H+ antiporter subunit F